MFEIMVIYMYIALGQTTPWGHFSKKYKPSVNLIICFKHSPFNNFVTVFPIQMHMRPNLTLA